MTSRTQDNFIEISSPGVAGWVDFIESDMIDDRATPDVNNIVYEGGFVSPREGSRKLTEKPSGAGDPLQLIEAITSDQVEYLIAVYGNKFYLWHPNVSRWVMLNTDFTPEETDRYWGYVSWNNGRSQDYVYACNGVDNFVKWHMAVSEVVGSHTASETTLTVEDATRFPDEGTVILGSVDGSVNFEWSYTSKSATELIADPNADPLPDSLEGGEAVTIKMVEMEDMEKGKILGKHGGRLFVMNRRGAEIAGFYSVLNDPEDFTSGSSIQASSSFVLSDGNGEITGFEDYGRFAVIAKEDSYHTFEIEISEDFGSKLDKIQPIISGTSIGPISQPSTIKMRNRIMYPTRTEGFYSLDPVSSGETTGSAIGVISQPIQNHVTEKTSFRDCRAVSYKQNALWAVADPNGNENVEVLMFDTLREAWTRFSGWAVKDWGRTNDNLYFLENGSGTMYECFTPGFNDENAPYEVSFYTKRFNFEAGSRQKVVDKIYVQGYMTPSTELYIDVLYNEGGVFDTKTYLIADGVPGLKFSNPITTAQGQVVLGSVAMGYVSSAQIGDISIFRTYLGADITKGFHNIQLRFRSNKEAFWAITGIAFNPQMNKATEQLNVISPV